MILMEPAMAYPDIVHIWHVKTCPLFFTPQPHPPNADIAAGFCRCG